MENINIQIPDFHKIISEELTKCLSEESLRKVVQENCTNIIKNSIDENFRTYSDFGKQLQNHISSCIGFDPSEIPVASYSKIVSDSFKEIYDKISDDEVKTKTNELMNSLVLQAPKKINLSELIKDYAEYVKDNLNSELKESVSYSDEGIFYHELHIDEEECNDYNYSYSSFRDIHIKVDNIEESFFRLHIYKYKNDNSHITYFCNSDKYFTSINIDLLKWSNLNSFEQKLYLLQTGKTNIILDYDKCPKYIEREDYGCNC